MKKLWAGNSYCPNYEELLKRWRGTEDEKVTNENEEDEMVKEEDILVRKDDEKKQLRL